MQTSVGYLLRMQISITLTSLVQISLMPHFERQTSPMQIYSTQISTRQLCLTQIFLVQFFTMLT
ncbi:hypothetical protein C442_02596 [Haloarcula amylolytica JCM 13557]|uniref:Uncharacterized protein n=1 Tax=Haloarcula amylolytica JCM 13557 TaxID=1227452 RepID=M0KVP0_9EURY|nr:hypothetical protein C442_02596 [Haloarcula amylolytica JCM 13557]